MRTTPSAARPPDRVVGDVMLIASEATLFGAFIGTYFYLRFTTAALAAGRDRAAGPSSVPIVLVARARATSVPMQLALAAAQAGSRRGLVLALVVQAGYLAYAVHDFARPAARVHATDATRTPRSTTRCSAPTTRTSSSGCSSTSGCSRSCARSDAHRCARRGDRVVLALRQRAHGRRDGYAPLGARMTSAASALQWVGLLGGAARGRRSTSSASGSRRPSAASAARAGASRTTSGSSSMLAVGGVSCSPPRSRRSTVFARTRDVEHDDAAARSVGSTSLATAALVANVLFLVVILLDGIASIADVAVPRRLSRSFSPLFVVVATGAAPVTTGKHLYGRYCAPATTRRTRRRCAASARSPPTSTSAPATCRCRRSACSRAAAGRRFEAAQIRRSSRTSRRSARAPPIPTPHPERGNLSQGMQLFTDHCAGCHQIVAEGGYVTGAVPPPLGRRDRHADRRGGAHRART